ncbi:MAG: linear amide C-N hydrolase [Clostridia bacterium]|nr:linear amide C-N hydrolase [Clostridia bacterium]
MCTSVCKTINGIFLFGRNLDLDYDFGEGVVVLPVGYALPLRHTEALGERLGCAGVGCIADGYPLLAEGMNEAGLCAAALDFPCMGRYADGCGDGLINLAPFEVLPYILGYCRSLDEAREVLSRCRIVDTPLSDKIKNTKMHYHIADRTGAVAVEIEGEQVKIYDNPFGTLTNAPDFSFHRDNMRLYSALEDRAPHDKGALFTNGVGALGMPGDYTSPSRFVRSAWLCARLKAEVGCEEAALGSVMGAVAVPRGSVTNASGKSHYTRYTSLLSPEEHSYTVFRCGTLTPSRYKIEKELLSGSSPSILRF